MRTFPPRFLAGGGTGQDDGGLASAAEAAGVEPLELDYLKDEREAHPLLPPWPLLDAAAAAGLPHALLGCFACEGDNVPQATQVIY